MSKPIYSKSQGISSEDVEKCENPFQLKKWALAIQRDCIAIKDGIEFLQGDHSQTALLLKRKAALRSQVQLLREIICRYNEAKLGVLPMMNEIVSFYQAAQRILPVELIDKINESVMKNMNVLP